LQEAGKKSLRDSAFFKARVPSGQKLPIFFDSYDNKSFEYRYAIVEINEINPSVGTHGAGPCGVN
jgi:hypothetical protein